MLYAKIDSLADDCVCHLATCGTSFNVDRFIHHAPSCSSAAWVHAPSGPCASCPMPRSHSYVSCSPPFSVLHHFSSVLSAFCFMVDAPSCSPVNDSCCTRPLRFIHHTSCSSVCIVGAPSGPRIFMLHAPPCPCVSCSPPQANQCLASFPLGPTRISLVLHGS